MGEVLSLTNRAAQVLEAIKRLRGFSDGEIADRAGLSRSAIEARRRGAKVIDVDDLERLGAALNVSPVVFLMEPIEAMRWVLDNAPSMEEPHNQDVLRGHGDPAYEAQLLLDLEPVAA